MTEPLPEGDSAPARTLRRLESDAITFDGLDDALIGVVTSGSHQVAVYSHAAMRRVFMERDGMTEEEADEWISYNVLPINAGPMTPLVVDITADSAFPFWGDN